MKEQASSAGSTGTFNRSASRYETFVGKILHRSLRWMLIYVVLLGGMVFLFLHLPTSFLPLEDRGMFTTSVQLPSGSTQQQTLKVVQKAEDYFLNNEKQNVESVFATVGSGPGGNGQNVARMFVRLKDWDQRDPQTGTSFAIIERATKAFNQINEARVICQQPAGDQRPRQFGRLRYGAGGSCRKGARCADGGARYATLSWPGKIRC